MALPAFDQLQLEWHQHTIKFTICPTLWEEKDVINGFFATKQIKNIKFFSDDASSINEDIKLVPNDKGGIYFFVLKNDVLPHLSSHIMYIGRAHFSGAQNLRKRCRVYFSKYYKDHYDRPHIHTMLKNWTNHLHLYYVELTNNAEIDEIEKKLINAMVPPFNHDVPNTEIKKVKTAVNAF